jgi:hypothetical protein
MNNNTHVDFDLHGLIGIRLVTPSEADIQAVKKQLGSLRVAPLDREPDITIRFEEYLLLPELKYLGRDQAGFTNDGFFILHSKKSKAKARIPFETIGSQCEIVCETGLRAVPLLIAILNLTLLNKGCIALHASAFVYGATGVLVTGWAKSGKTEALLAFAAHGARYVGDEWVILTKDGETMYGLPEPMTVWDWHIDQLPRIRDQLTITKSLAFKAIHLAGRLQNYFGNGRMKNTLPMRLMADVMPALNRQLFIKVPVEQLFAKDAIELISKPEKLFLIMSQEQPGIAVEAWSSEDIARRMLESIYYEQVPFFEYFNAFKFAFPEARNDFLENVRMLQSDILTSALRNKEAYRVLHPYPFSFEDLYREMAPYCRDLNSPKSL